MPEILKFCSYHTHNCVGDHEGIEGPKIKMPNALGLCTECYGSAQQSNEKLTPLSPRSVPGVAPVSVENQLKKLITEAEEKKEMEEAEKMANALTERTRCKWKPNKEEKTTDAKFYTCTSYIMRNPVTNALMHTCALHVRVCIRAHVDPAGAAIKIPNIYALCNLHHEQEHGTIPIPIPFPYPGMQKKVIKGAWALKPGKYDHLVFVSFFGNTTHF